MTSSLLIRRAAEGDRGALHAIRVAAFAPEFASLRALLGDEIHALANPRHEQEQKELLDSMFAPDTVWELYVAVRGGHAIGFVSARLDAALRIGELGLNAVHPEHAGGGVGTALYEHALARMREAGFTKGIPSVWLCRAL